MTEETGGNSLIELATELTIAWLSNPNTRASVDEVPGFLDKMHGALASLSSPITASAEPAAADGYVPAVTARRSLASKDHIISLIDGKPYKTLKRHLSTHGLTPDEYRSRYGLKPDYPMVAENYALMRRAMAKKIGLGRKPGTKVAAKPAAAAKAAGAARPKAGAKSKVPAAA